MFESAVIISAVYVGFRRQGCEFSGTMAVNIDIIVSTAAVFPHYCDTHGADVKIKMMIVFIPIEPPTSR